MPAFGTVTVPARSLPSHPLEVNRPDGWLTDPESFGELWWLGIHDSWLNNLPPALSRGTAIITNPLCRMSWSVNGLNPGDPGYPVWLADPMLANGSSGGPNTGIFPKLDRLDRFNFWVRVVTHALWFGVSPWSWIPDGTGQPKAGTLSILSPSRLYRNDDGWAISSRSGIHPIDDEGRVEGSDVHVSVLRHSIPGGALGRHRQAMEISRKVMEYGRDSFDTSTPSGVITTDQPINQEQADSIRTEGERIFYRRRLGVLGWGSDYKQVTASPLDSDLVNMARLSNEHIAHCLELQAWQLDASTNSLTYSNSRDMRADLITGVLAGWAARIEECVGSLLPWGTRVTVEFPEFVLPTEQETDNGPTDPA